MPSVTTLNSRLLAKELREALGRAAGCYLDRDGKRVRIYNVKRDTLRILLRAFLSMEDEWTTLVPTDVVVIDAATPREQLLSLGASAPDGGKP